MRADAQGVEVFTLQLWRPSLAAYMDVHDFGDLLEAGYFYENCREHFPDGKWRLTSRVLGLDDASPFPRSLQAQPADQLGVLPSSWPTLGAPPPAPHPGRAARRKAERARRPAGPAKPAP